MVGAIALAKVGGKGAVAMQPKASNLFLRDILESSLELNAQWKEA
jgi:hypothetical protein